MGVRNVKVLNGTDRADRTDGHRANRQYCMFPAKPHHVSGNRSQEVLHNGNFRAGFLVNNRTSMVLIALISLAEPHSSPVVNLRISVNKLWTRIHCRIWEFRYDVRSSLKELRWTAVIV